VLSGEHAMIEPRKSNVNLGLIDILSNKILFNPDKLKRQVYLKKKTLFRTNSFHAGAQTDFDV